MRFVGLGPREKEGGADLGNVFLINRIGLVTSVI